MTNHMHVASYFPEPYEGRLEVAGKEYSIAEIATSSELPPILARFGVWAVTTEGIHCLTKNYFIAKQRFDQETDGRGWIEHMEEKTWVNMDDFGNALLTGRDFMRLGILCSCRRNKGQSANKAISFSRPQN